MGVVNLTTLRLIADLELDFVLGAAVSEIVNFSDGDAEAIERAQVYLAHASAQGNAKVVPPSSPAPVVQARTNANIPRAAKVKRKATAKTPRGGAKTCITCHEPKGATAFKKGNDECIKCGKSSPGAVVVSGQSKGSNQCVMCEKIKMSGAFPAGSATCRKCLGL